MDLASFRTERGLSQEQCAVELGLQSKSYISGIETGSQPAGLRLGLQIQIWSQGRIQAVDVVSDDDRKLLEDAARRRARGGMSRTRTPAKFIPDPLLGQLVEQIAHRECSARASPYLVEAAWRQRARPPSLVRRLIAWLGG